MPIEDPMINLIFRRKENPMMINRSTSSNITRKYRRMKHSCRVNTRTKIMMHQNVPAKGEIWLEYLLHQNIMKSQQSKKRKNISLITVDESGLWFMDFDYMINENDECAKPMKRRK